MYIEFLILIGCLLLVLLYFQLIEGNIEENFELSFVIKPSTIEGYGVFSTKDFEKNSRLLKAIYDNNEITLLGRKINHCQLEKTNTFLQKDDDGWYLYALKDIKKDDELLCDYNGSPSFIKKPNSDWVC